jgi:hypothetical protein
LREKPFRMCTIGFVTIHVSHVVVDSIAFICREGWEGLYFLKFYELMKQKSTISHCNIKLLVRSTNRVDKDSGNNKTAEDNSVDKRKSHNIGEDIKKGMDRFEAKIKSGETPAGDATRSEE